MIVFSEVHNWQNDSAVKQILVFTCEEMKTRFYEAFAVRVLKYGIDDATDSDLGAIYKLRAVKCSDDKWAAIIRCGFIGKHVWEDPMTYDNPTLALSKCAKHLENSTKVDITNLLWNYVKGR